MNLNNDFILCLISLLCMIIYSRSRLIGYSFISVLLALGLSLDIWRAYKVELLVSADMSWPGPGIQSDNDFYFQPWFRSSPYFIGLLLGIIYRNYSNDVKVNNKKSSNVLYLMFNSKHKTVYVIISYILGFGIVFSIILSIIYIIFLINYFKKAPMDLLINGQDHWNLNV